MDRRRLADIRAGTTDAVEASGTGYLIGASLVVTARHVVLNERNVARPRIEVRVGHQDDGPRKRCKASVRWISDSLDLALLQVDPGISGFYPAVRWGCFVGTEPCRYEGLGFPKFVDYDSGQGVEQLGGELPPLALGPDGCYVLDQSSAPEAGDKKSWGGASGAAVFCGGLLVGVVAKDDRFFRNRRLHATRIVDAFRDPEFTRLISKEVGIRPIVESVELSEYLRSPVGSISAKTPGSLLAPDVEVVDFTGRDDVMDSLVRWRDAPTRLSVALIAGQGGEGKTRLAREFAIRASSVSWIAGFYDPLAGNGRWRHRAAGEEFGRLLRSITRPILIVADYAETSPNYIESIIDELQLVTPQTAIRLLLLARGVGAWWESITDMLPENESLLILLPPLSGGIAERDKAYVAALSSLARHLEFLQLDDLSNGQGTDWHLTARRLSNGPFDLSDDRFGNALTLQMTALNSLLASASARMVGRTAGTAEQGLVKHESNYLKRAAAKRMLFERDVLSSRMDGHERRRDAWERLERAIAGMILLGPTGAVRLRKIGELASLQHAQDVTAWLASLYPPRSAYEGIGTMQPDRLAEHFLGNILLRDFGLLEQIAAMADGLDEAIAILFTLLRVASHPRFAAIGQQARELVASHPIPFAEAALTLTVNLAHVASLQGVESSVIVLETVLKHARSVQKSTSPNALAIAMRLASERLEFLRTGINLDEAPSSSRDAVFRLTPAVAESQFHERYGHLARGGGSRFLENLLEVALSIIGVESATEASQEAQEVEEGEEIRLPITSVPSPEVSTNSFDNLARIYVERYFELVRLATALGHDVATAEDIVQATFLRLFERSEELVQRDPHILIGYLRRVLVNQSQRYLSYGRRDENVIDYDIFDLDRETESALLPAADDEISRIVDRDTVDAALRTLPERPQEALRLYYLEDLSLSEVALRMGITAHAASGYVRRGLERLRGEFK